jgi:hypothetical protein
MWQGLWDDKVPNAAHALLQYYNETMYGHNEQIGEVPQIHHDYTEQEIYNGIL